MGNSRETGKQVDITRYVQNIAPIVVVGVVADVGLFTADDLPLAHFSYDAVDVSLLALVDDTTSRPAASRPLIDSRETT